MIRLLKWVLSLCFICWFLNTCVYHHMTHMNKEEVNWAANRKQGETWYFESSDGVVDTAEIREVVIFNSLNPINWAYFNTSNKAYLASATVYYSLRNGGGVLCIMKEKAQEPIRFSSVLSDGNWQNDVLLNVTSLRINDTILNDVMHFENENSKDSIPANSIRSYSWSQRYGLVQYILQDGSVFNRIGVE